MKLTEIATNTDVLDKAKTEFLTDPADIQQWLDLMGSSAHVIVNNGIVACIDTINFAGFSLQRLPFKFGVVNGNFQVGRNDLTSFQGFPTRIEGYLMCSKNPKIKSFDGCPSYVESNFYCSETSIDSLVGISDHIKFIGGAFKFEDNIKSGGIGLILIEGLRNIMTDLSGDYLPPWAEIVKKYLGKPEDIYECQAELIDAGFEQHAIL